MPKPVSCPKHASPPTTLLLLSRGNQVCWLPKDRSSANSMFYRSESPPPSSNSSFPTSRVALCYNKVPALGMVLTWRFAPRFAPKSIIPDSRIFDICVLDPNRANVLIPCPVLQNRVVSMRNRHVLDRRWILYFLTCVLAANGSPVVWTSERWIKRSDG